MITLKKNTLIPQAAKSMAVLLAWAALRVSSPAQTVAYGVDQFSPAGTGGYSYTGGQINKVWTNWFGTAFQSATWDATSDASNNASSGSLKIAASFSASLSQYEIYDGFNGINPPLSGLQYTNFQCDVRFAAGSATTSNGGAVSFGHLQFGVATPAFGQDYFGSIDVPASNTNWVHVSLPINAVSDTNLLQISDVLIHIYGPTYSSGLSGASTLWVDNLQFTGAAPATNGACTVDWNTVYQRIDGFGASSAWLGNWNTTEANMFFATNTAGTGTSLDGRTNFAFTSIGLSLLRNHIVYAGSTAATATPTTGETTIMQYAQARGAAVWSTPWTPASGFKSNNGPNGGNYLGSGNNATNLAYASQLANYVAGMKSQGVNIYAISLQNEPDAPVTTYEACVWTGAQYHDFVTNLSSALAAKGVSSTKIILPESESWGSNNGLFTPTLNDASTASAVGIVADHDYVANNLAGDLTTPAPLPVSGKTTWETEVSQIGGGFDGSITNALYWAGRIHLYLTQAQVNAWHYWWLIPLSGNPDNEGLTDTNGVPAKRMYAMGQFARFVRPNYYRIAAGNNTSPALISAYKDSQSPNFAVVAVNGSSSAVTQVINFTNVTGIASVTPWVTTASQNLASQPAVTVSNSSFTYTLPALSIVTFAGQAATNPPPRLAGVASQVVNAGVTLVLTNTATDTNLPTPLLAFSLLSAPTNAVLTTVNGTNGIFTWRPLVSQANTTNLVSVKVGDNGTPSLSATNNFTITVNPLTLPAFGSATVSTGRVILTVNGAAGPDYTLLTSTNLTTWQALLTTNAPQLPLTLTDTNSGNAARFYRIQIGP